MPAKAGEVQDKQTIFEGGVPVYPGARVLKTPSAENIISAKLEAKASITDIVAFYKKALSERGWQPGMAMARGGKASVTFTKGNAKIIMSGREQGSKSRFDIKMVKQ